MLNDADKIEIADKLIELLKYSSLENDDIVLINTSGEYLVFKREYGSRVHGVLYSGLNLLDAMEFLSVESNND